MTSTLTRATVFYAAATVILSVLPPIIEWFSPRPGLIRSLYAQNDFSGGFVDARTTEISLRFLDESPALPRQHFSARWRGYFYLSEPQSVEFFAGGDDEVQLRVNGELLLNRNLRDGMGTRSRTVTLEAGAHAIAVDYRQFGGNLRLNIQRTLAGQLPQPFLPTELFSERVGARQVLVLDMARTMRRTARGAQVGLALLLVIAFGAHHFKWWLTVGAPRSMLEYGGRLWIVAAPALLAPALVFLIGPHTIFSSNTGEFALPFAELAAPWLLRTTVINWAILFAAGCAVAALSARATQIYAAMLFALGLAVWAQGHSVEPGLRSHERRRHPAFRPFVAHALRDLGAGRHPPHGRTVLASGKSDCAFCIADVPRHSTRSGGSAGERCTGTSNRSGRNRRPTSSSFQAARTSSTSCWTNFSQTCLPRSWNRIDARSNRCSAASHISVTTQPRFPPPR